RRRGGPGGGRLDGRSRRPRREALEPSAAERTQLFTARRASLDLYGYEAMELILDAVDAGGGARGGAVAAAPRGRASGPHPWARARDSILGRYSVWDREPA